MFRVDPLAHGGSGNAYTRSSGIAKRTLVQFIYLFVYPSSASEGKRGRNGYIKES